jgi:hypothetical protein
VVHRAVHNSDVQDCLAMALGCRPCSCKSLQVLGNSYYTNTGSWNSSHTDVATVGSSTGQRSGISPGTTNLSDYFSAGDISIDVFASKASTQFFARFNDRLRHPQA